MILASAAFGGETGSYRLNVLTSSPVSPEVGPVLPCKYCFFVPGKPPSGRDWQMAGLSPVCLSRVPRIRVIAKKKRRTKEKKSIREYGSRGTLGWWTSVWISRCGCLSRRGAPIRRLLLGQY
jgi:hypothetical protein